MNRIRKCRQNKKLTLKQLSEELAKQDFKISADALGKYEGLNGTELAISESQERMAVVIAPEDLEKFRAAADRENLESTHVADVTDTGRLRMYWQGSAMRFWKWTGRSSTILTSLRR